MGEISKGIKLTGNDPRDVIILAIESSCDDTSAAVIRNETILSNVVAGQKVHEAYGGVVPELASRAHQQNIIPVVDVALRRAGVSRSEISAVAFTRGPGLLGSLLVGTSFAKAFALALGVPLIEVNHLQAHVLALFIREPGMADGAAPQLTATPSAPSASSPLAATQPVAAQSTTPDTSAQTSDPSATPPVAAQATATPPDVTPPSATSPSAATQPVAAQSATPDTSAQASAPSATPLASTPPSITSLSAVTSPSAVTPPVAIQAAATQPVAALSTTPDTSAQASAPSAMPPVAAQATPPDVTPPSATSPSALTSPSAVTQPVAAHSATPDTFAQASAPSAMPPVAAQATPPDVTPPSATSPSALTSPSAVTQPVAAHSATPDTFAQASAPLATFPAPARATATASASESASESASASAPVYRVPSFPFLCLLVSGGNSQIILVKDHLHMEVIGQTIDDAAGEAFDKCAKVMGLPYPGGPFIDRLAKEGNPHRFLFTKPAIPGLDYSFSGLKTNFLYFLRDQLKVNPDFIEQNKADLAASLQKTIIDILLQKLTQAAKETHIRDIAIAGGVSANSGLRNAIQAEALKRHWNVFIPKFEFTMDNAAMIAIAGYYKYLRGEFTSQDAVPYSRTHL